MNDEVPDVIYDDLRAGVIECLRVGKKCVVNFHPTDEGQVIAVGGPSTPDGVSVSHLHTRVFYEIRASSREPQVRVILAENAHFLGSRKGMVKSRSKSFDENGNPVFQVKLLYALMTGRYDDRIRALEEYPFWDWPGDNFGEKLKWMRRLAAFDMRFEEFVGSQIVRSITDNDGLSDWNNWESVASAAVASSNNYAKSARGRTTIANRQLLIDSLREEAQKYHGLPAQVHVRENWERRGGEGDWKEVRKTFGIEWIPSKADWDRDWQKPVLAPLRGG